MFVVAIRLNQVIVGGGTFELTAGQTRHIDDITVLTRIWKTVFDFNNCWVDSGTLQQVDDFSVLHPCCLLTVDCDDHVTHLERVAPVVTSS